MMTRTSARPFRSREWFAAPGRLIIGIARSGSSDEEIARRKGEGIPPVPASQTPRHNH